LRKLGTVRFGKVAMHPGAPQRYGAVGSAVRLIVTVPGDTVDVLELSP
jgi:molybdopterin biosynthesis enzyme